ncbi:MAG TPA: hypothetical protein VK714_11355 [Myxococcota bacterium]|nr:hypothetical protein [Myxococcota bacterium]
MPKSKSNEITNGRGFRKCIAWAPIGLALLVSACSLQQAVWQIGLPSTETGFAVQTVVPRGGYLDAVLKGPNFTLRTFTVDSDECRNVLMPETEVRYLEGLPGGSFRRGQVTCDSAGIGSLARWRDRRARVAGIAQPRAQASFRRTLSDNEVIFVRGRFPLATLVGWVSLDDTVAALPDTPSCRRRADEGVASLEFRQSGLDPLILVGSEEPCPLIGLLRPLDTKPDVRKVRDTSETFSRNQQ